MPRSSQDLVPTSGDGFAARLKGALERNEILFNAVRPLAVAGGSARTTLRAVGTALRRMRLLSARPGAIRAYTSRHGEPRLQIGGGDNDFPGWLNSDIEVIARDRIYLDALRRFPFPDATFCYAYTEHMIEHLTVEGGERMLRECFRVLRPGGVLRVATPDLRNLLRLFDAEPTDEAVRYGSFAIGFSGLPRRPAMPCYVLNNFMRAWGHQFVYDGETLAALLREVGFADVTRLAVSESADENLRGLESHGTAIGEDVNRFETMVFEATRPA